MTNLRDSERLIRAGEKRVNLDSRGQEVEVEGLEAIDGSGAGDRHLELFRFVNQARSPRRGKHQQGRRGKATRKRERTTKRYMIAELMKCRYTNETRSPVVHIAGCNPELGTGRCSVAR